MKAPPKARDDEINDYTNANFP